VFEAAHAQGRALDRDRRLDINTTGLLPLTPTVSQLR
jgi:hypothetical protein